MENKKLEVGEEYLNIQVEFGGQKFSFAAFKNKNKVNPREPEYRGNNVAVWVTTKKAPKEVDGVKVEDI